MNMIELAHGRTRVTVAPDAGGRIAQVELRDHDGAWLPLLAAPEDEGQLLAEPLMWGCYPMAPWPGRVDGARFTWRGRTHELPVNDGAHSIHGRAVYLPWSVAHEGDSFCLLTVDIGPEEGWPFPGRVLQHIGVQDEGLMLRLEVRALEDAVFPVGAGWHPWFRRDVRPDIEPAVQMIASEMYERRDDLIPTGATEAPYGDAELRDGPELGERRLDHFYRGVTEPIRIQWGDVELLMTSSANATHAVVYTSERGFCVEPQTCAPDAFNLAARGLEGTGLAVVDAGHPLVVESAWRWRILFGQERASRY